MESAIPDYCKGDVSYIVERESRIPFPINCRDRRENSDGVIPLYLPFILDTVKWLQNGLPGRSNIMT